jgi:putative sterol carrier protein
MTAKEFILTLPERASDIEMNELETVFHFELSGEGGGEMTVVLKDNKVESLEGLIGEPKCTLKAKAENFMKLIKGDLNPMMAMMTGKIKISNPGEMLKYAKVLGLM